MAVNNQISNVFYDLKVQIVEVRHFNRKLFARDGLHYNHAGKLRLGSSIARVIYNSKGKNPGLSKSFTTSQTINCNGDKNNNGIHNDFLHRKPYTT